MKKTWSRRQFLKGSAAGGLAYGLAPLLALNARPVAAKPSIPERVQQTLHQMTAAPLASALPLGQPLADLSMGWDGSLWGIDTDGVPYTFNQIAQAWEIVGRGFDCVAIYDNLQNPLLVRGSEVYSPRLTHSVPTSIASVWSNLPASFTLGLDGLAMAAGVLYLFCNGRYVAIDPTTNAASAPVALTSISGWPSGDSWQHGVIDAVGAHATNVTNPFILLWSQGEYVFVDMTTKTVTDGPHPLDYYVSGDMLAAMQQGFTSILWDESANYQLKVFNGPVIHQTAQRNGPVYSVYAAGYYPGWVPQLGHAPSGQTNSLWGIGTYSPNFDLFQYDGTNWNIGATTGLNAVASVAVGLDGNVFALSDTGLGSTNLKQFDPTTQTWAIVASTTSAPIQLSVGDTNHIWARDAHNTVYRRNGSNFNAVSLGHPATDIAAGSDGTLWYTADTPNIYRFLSESTMPSTVISGDTNNAIVTKVASTGFGTAYMLTREQAQVFSYPSPYVFKTSTAYYGGNDMTTLRQTLSTGGHSLFVSSVSIRQTTTGSVAALDAQSGLERWSVPFTRLSRSTILNFYDSTLELVYVVNDLDIYALNAATGAQVWHLNLASGLPANSSVANAALLGTQLCIGTFTAKLVVIDTADAFDRAQKQQPPQVRWIATIEPEPLVATLGIPTSDTNGTLYIVSKVPNNQQPPHVTAVDATTGLIIWQVARTEANATSVLGDDLWWDSIVGTTQLPNASTTTPAVFVNIGTGVVALNPTDGSVLHTYVLPQPNAQAIAITSAMAYRDDRLYFGDTLGKLYVVNALTLQQVTTTTDTPQPFWRGVRSQPVLIAGKTASDGLVVAFTRGNNPNVSNRQPDQYIYLFDPASGNLDQITTDLTVPGTLAYDDAHGVLYAMAWSKDPTIPDDIQLGQLFAVRPDSFIQDERSFIIESELLQDFASDAEAAGNGVSRYQTHVTMVDGDKATRPNQSIKLWADEDGLAVTIDGTAYTIGPDTPAFFTTDASGSFTIITTADDLATVTLRVWAPFMDPYERIAIVPDAAFHTRLAMTSTTTTDPQQINAQTATAFDGTPLSDNADQAGQIATTVTQLTSSVGMGTGTTTLLRGGVQTHTSTSRYIAYPQHQGLAYTPINVSATQDVTAQMALGLHLTPQGVTLVTPAQAADFIDHMADPSTMLLGGFLSNLKSAWKEITSEAGQVAQVVVSVSKDVYAGIMYVVNGVTKIVKAVVQDIKDAAAAIGSFFVMLGKDLLKVIEALSMLLHLGEVKATAQLIRGQITQRFDQLQAILTRGKNALDTTLEGAENEVKALFNQLYAALGLPQDSIQVGADGSNPPVNGFGDLGTTPTDVYNTGQNGKPSQAVQCGWSAQTLRTNVGSAAPPPSVSNGTGVNTPTDPFTTFYASLITNPALVSQLKAVQTSFSDTFKVSSVEQFFQMALKDLLEVFETMLVTGVAITKAMVDSLLSDIAAFVAQLQGFLNDTVQIPVLSGLLKKLGFEPTYLGVLSFAIALPVTIIYRGITGSYPQSSTSQLAAEDGGFEVKTFNALVGGMATLFYGITSAIVDIEEVTEDGGEEEGAEEGTEEGTERRSARHQFVATALLTVKFYTSLYEAIEEPTDQACSLAGIGAFEAMLSFAEAKKLGTGPSEQTDGLPSTAVILTVLDALTSALGIILAGSTYSQSEKDADAKLALSGEVVGSFPTVMSPIKFAGPPIGYILPVTDFACRLAAGFIIMSTAKTEETATRRYSAFLPIVAR